MNVHTLYAVNIATVSDVDLFIDQISNFSIDPGIEDMLVGADGSVDNTFLAVGNQAPRISFTTSALATALATAGISGLKIDSDADDDGLECWFQKVTEGATRGAESTHIKMTVNEGMLVPRTLSAAHNEPATLEYEVVISYDGTNDPIVIATSASLEGTASVGEVFTCGPVSINGTTLAGIQDISIDFGLTEYVIGADGTVWPTFVAIQERSPVITIKTTEVAALNTFGITGVAQGTTDSVVYLRKISEGATRVAAATAQHISFTIDEGMIRVTDISGGNNDMQVATVEIKPTYDGTNAVMVIDAAVAIT